MLWAVSRRNILFILLKNTLPSVSFSPISVILRRRTVTLMLDYSHSLLNLLFFWIAVLTKGGQIWRRNQSSDWQTQRGEMLIVKYLARSLLRPTRLSRVTGSHPVGRHVHVVSIAGWDPCRVCREIRGQTGEDHRRFGRYSTLTCRVFFADISNMPPPITEWNVITDLLILEHCCVVQFKLTITHLWWSLD